MCWVSEHCVGNPILQKLGSPRNGDGVRQSLDESIRIFVDVSQKRSWSWHCLSLSEKERWMALGKVAARVRWSRSCASCRLDFLHLAVGHSDLVLMMSTAYPPGTAPVKRQSVPRLRSWLFRCSQTLSAEDMSFRCRTKSPRMTMLPKGTQVMSIMADRRKPMTVPRTHRPRERSSP